MKLIVHSALYYEYEVEIDDLAFISMSDEKLADFCKGEDPVLPACFEDGKLVPFCNPDECEFFEDFITTEDGTLVAEIW